MKELDEYIEYLYGEDKDDEIFTSEIEEISAGFLAGYNVLRRKLLIKYSNVKKELKDINNLPVTEQIFKTREINGLNNSLKLLKELLDEN